MLDTNSIVQLAQVTQAILDATRNTQHALNPWLPAMAIAAAWFGRELTRFSAWLQTAAVKIITHGGILKIILKLIWN